MDEAASSSRWPRGGGVTFQPAHWCKWPPHVPEWLSVLPPRVHLRKGVKLFHWDPWLVVPSGASPRGSPGRGWTAWHPCRRLSPEPRGQAARTLPTAPGQAEDRPTATCDPYWFDVHSFLRATWAIFLPSSWEIITLFSPKQ